MASHREVEDRAAEWLAKRDSGYWSVEDQGDLKHWLEESIAHRVAFLRLEDAWDGSRRLRALGAGRLRGIVPPRGEWRGTPFFGSNRMPPEEAAVASTEIPARTEFGEQGEELGSLSTSADGLERESDMRAEESSTEPGLLEPTARDAQCLVSPRRVESTETAAVGATHSPQVNASRRTWHGERFRRRLWMIAAGLLLVVGTGTYIALSPVPGRYSTSLGRIESVPLQDGSNITLNTASTVHVDLTTNERLVDLQQGEAFFKVAKDPRRPFVVRVGGRRVVAVGTQFSVRRDGDDVCIVVTEGTVRLGSTSLPAGTVARSTEEDVLVEKESISEAEELLSWRQGYLRFHDTSLAEAVAQFNRYNAHTIAIDDPKLAAIRISGTFRPTNYQAFVHLLRDGYDIRADERGDRVVLTKN